MTLLSIIALAGVAFGALCLYAWACMELIYAHYGGKEGYLDHCRRNAEIHAEYERRFGR